MKKAFTLIELLVVIAIIAILAAMLMPALTKARKTAKIASCSAQVHNLGLGWAMFRKDHNGEYTREKCDAWDTSPDVCADIVGLGYLADADVYLCPSLDDPLPRHPHVDYWYTFMPNEPTTTQAYTGDAEEVSYFADEARIPKEPNERRAILADGIEMVTRYGKEPANHADSKQRAEGANVLFVDNVVQWIPTYRPEHEWTTTLLGHTAWGAGEGMWPPAADVPTANSLVYGYNDGEDWYPMAMGGTWRRMGFIQNVRLLNPSAEAEPGGGVGNGEDDLNNQIVTVNNVVTDIGDVDDIYYVECTTKLYGNNAKWSFIAYARGARCDNLNSKSKIDCSLCGGEIWWWRGAYADDPVPNAYSGDTWGWPDETWP